ncbi:tripartite tricarboxylate transporter substrate binding protein [Kiritimatiella glycovorans]|uniref:Tripartite tricarboxylate transporter family receptor n=1 Tax=Kiritimatiella glycovorans TaxID=1307763 RepID=A0A0G3ELA7_9BACT|nr:tripartite tricarboxylate transporter substrate binding protein [Kiritimatiella glycovorans]AKJ64914.1 Tripartite tricarboxylate transporter family receptor [Kiritimatiella glycovorans]
MFDRKNAWAWAVIVIAIVALAWMNWQRRAAGGSFPQRPVTLICPFSPGGGTDLLSRKLAHEAEKRLGVPVLVSNLTGGGGAIGHAAGRVAPVDGYTVLMTTFELISLPVQGLAPFTHEDFDLLMLLNMDPAAVAVRSDHPAQTLEEFVRGAKTGEPPSIGNSGAGAVWHLAAAMLADRTDMPAVHVPFNGASQAITSLIGGHIDAVTVSPAELKTYVESGQVRLLGVMSDGRLEGFPDTPTCREQGYDLVFGTWRGLALPEGVPPDRRAVLAGTFRAVAESDAFETFAAQSGMNLHVAGHEDFRALAERQSEEVARTMRKLGLVE